MIKPLLTLMHKKLPAPNVIPQEVDHSDGSDYMRNDEVILLLFAGFRTGLSDTTFWKKGSDCVQYTAAVIPGRVNLSWYTQRERGGLSNYKDSADTPYMTREDFIRLFR